MNRDLLWMIYFLIAFLISPFIIRELVNSKVWKPTDNKEIDYGDTALGLIFSCVWPAYLLLRVVRLLARKVNGYK